MNVYLLLALVVLLVLIGSAPAINSVFEARIRRAERRAEWEAERQYRTWSQPLTDVEDLVRWKTMERDVGRFGAQWPAAVACGCDLDAAIESLRTYIPEASPFAVFASDCPVHGEG